MRGQSHRLIDFDTVEIRILESFPESYVLVVRGMKPYLSMTVRLVPLIYVQQPKFWGIEVVGCLSGIGLPALAPYTESISLTGITGTEGIEAIGATKSVREYVPPRHPPLPSGDLQAVEAFLRFIRYDIGPGDDVIEVPGHWSARTPTEIDVFFKDPRIAPMTLHVLSLSDDELRIRA